MPNKNTHPCGTSYIDPRPYRFQVERLKQRIKVAAKQRRLLKDQRRAIRDEARKLWREEQKNYEFPQHLSEKRRHLYQMVVRWEFIPRNRKAFVSRREVRAMYLAYAFCRGRTYRSVEPHVRDQWDRDEACRVAEEIIWNTIIFHYYRDKSKENRELLKEAVYAWFREKDQPPEMPDFVMPTFEKHGVRKSGKWTVFYSYERDW